MLTCFPHPVQRPANLLPQNFRENFRLWQETAKRLNSLLMHHTKIHPTIASCLALEIINAANQLAL